MKLIKKGKVKDIYEVSSDTLIFSFSNRVSAFDVVMDDEIPFKGKVLCDFAVFWFENLDFSNHFIRRISPTMIEVKKLHMVPIECVVRAYLYGSLYSRYLNNSLNLDDMSQYFQKKDLKLASKLPQILFDIYPLSQASRNASNTRAELLAAKLRNVFISLAPSFPPARSLSERNAINGTPLL